MTYPLAFSTWGKEEIEAIQRVIDTDMYTMGKHVKQFEKEIAESVGIEGAIILQWVKDNETATYIKLEKVFSGLKL